MDWLSVWGGNVIGFVFGEPLEELATEALRDSVKKFFQSDLPGDAKTKRLEVLEVAFGQAVREFLQLFQQELEDADLPTADVKRYNKSLKKFFRDPLILTELGKPFREAVADADILAKQWHICKLRSLPQEFNWQRLIKRYTRKVYTILHESDELQDLLDETTDARGVPNFNSSVGIILSGGKTSTSKVAIGRGAMATAMEWVKQIPAETNKELPDFILQLYREAIQHTYGHLRLDSFDTSGYAYRLQLWNLFAPQHVREAVEVSPQVYELPQAELQQLQALGDLEAPVPPEQLEQVRQRYGEQSPRSVLELLKDAQHFPRTVILGDPGSGKSSLVQYIALDWAEAQPFAPFPLPLVVELRTYIHRESQGQDFLDFVRQGSTATYPFERSQLESLLQQGRVFVLLDGLDEVFNPDQRSQVEAEILDFAQRYPQTRLLLTSRLIGYKSDRWRTAGFRHFVLQDFDDAQVEDFIDRWHEFAYPSGRERERKRDRLKLALQDSTAIRQLAGNPLLLTMMAILNRNQELPRDRAELYGQSSRVLLQQWDVEKALETDEAITIDYKDKQAMLRQVAFQMQTTDSGLSGNLIRGEELHQILAGYLKDLQVHDPADAANRVIAQLRERNFILCFVGADYYAFVHRTFLEYFCAWEYVWRFEKERAIDLDYLKQQVFLPHYQDESWHEILRLICSMIDSRFVGEIVEFLMEIPLDRAKLQVDGFNFALENTYDNLLLAADCVNEARNRTVIAATSQKLLNKLQALLKSGEFSGKLSAVPGAIVHAIAVNWKDEPSVLPWLKTLTQLNEITFLPSATVQEIAQGWKADPETLTWLKNCIQSNRDPFTQSTAVSKLAQGWKDELSTLPMLKHIAQSDQNSFVRSAAVAELAQGWKNEPSILPILQHIAQSDQDFIVRRIAVEKLAEEWKDELSLLPMLKHIAQSDVDKYVQITAIKALVQIGRNTTEIFEFLYDLVLQKSSAKQLNPSQNHSRLTALQMLVENYPMDEKLLNLLQDRAAKDPDEQVRDYAREQLEQVQTAEF